jgi:hypothetical protein
MRPGDETCLLIGGSWSCFRACLKTILPTVVAEWNGGVKVLADNWERKSRSRRRIEAERSVCAVWQNLSVIALRFRIGRHPHGGCGQVS